MNTIEIESARQELPKVCKSLPSDATHDSVYKEAIVNDEYSVLLYVSPTIQNRCSVEIFNNSGSGRDLINGNLITGENPKKLSTDLVNEAIRKLEDIYVKGKSDIITD